MTDLDAEFAAFQAEIAAAEAQVKATEALHTNDVLVKLPPPAVPPPGATQGKLPPPAVPTQGASPGKLPPPNAPPPAAPIAVPLKPQGAPTLPPPPKPQQYATRPIGNVTGAIMRPTMQLPEAAGVPRPQLAPPAVPPPAFAQPTATPNVAVPAGQFAYHGVGILPPPPAVLPGALPGPPAEAGVGTVPGGGVQPAAGSSAAAGTMFYSSGPVAPPAPPSAPPAPPPNPPKAGAHPKAVPRAAGGEKWWDPTLLDWPENDFRIFVGDLGNEVNDEALTKAFSKYSSLAKAKIVRDKRSNKTKGYGFVSLLDPLEGARAIREMNGKYIGNRPCKLRKSTWDERNDEAKLKKLKKKNRKHV